MLLPEATYMHILIIRSVYLAGRGLTVSGIFTSWLLAVSCIGKACFGLAVGCTGKAASD